MRKEWLGYEITEGLYPLSDMMYTAKSREFPKPRDSELDFSNRYEIWQKPRQQRRRDASQISEPYDNHNHRPRGFETSRDLAATRFTA